MGKIQEIRESKTGKKIVKRKERYWPDSVLSTGIILLLLLLQLGFYFIIQQTAAACNLCLLVVCLTLGADSDTDYQPTGKSGV